MLWTTSLIDATFSYLKFIFFVRLGTSLIMGVSNKCAKIGRIWNLGRLYSFGELSGSLQDERLGIQLARESPTTGGRAIVAILAVCRTRKLRLELEI